ncbi:MAG TPA: DUF4838 domain-containing protein [Saprospiraceae bacterium]|nr:DUF4838 domain-containing protein [Saprospiraceae bacterium]
MRYIYLVLLLFSSGILLGQPVSLILSPKATAAETRAAAVLKSYLSKITRQPITVTRDPKSEPVPPAIFIGNSMAAQMQGFAIPEAMEEDALFLHGKGGMVALGGGGELGAEYAAYSLLELLGCRRYSPRDTFMPRFETLQLPGIPARVETPAFPYRELWYEPATDDSWARWHKLKTPTQKTKEWGMFVHTFDKLCPQNQYFKEHPEYYAFNGSQRSPGQLCLSNDTVFQIVVAGLRSLIAQNPEARYWSVSQNDNYDYCKCPRCAAADRKYESAAGSLLLFVNRVAQAFPDKIISTLAYQYTRKAPKGLKPEPNVNICLCSIECNRGNPIEEGCADFANDVREWSALTKNLMIWDYVVQFRSYFGPFPNWKTLQPNLQFFQKNGVRMMFEQGSGRDRSEFSDMRAYLLAKLMWNPNASQDSILSDFRKGYYGDYADLVGRYVKDNIRRMEKHGKKLWIYDVPQNEAFVRDSFFYRMMQFDQSMPKPSDPKLEQRLRPIVLVELISFLENMKCVPPVGDDFMSQNAYMMFRFDTSGLHDMFTNFEKWCSEAGMLHMNENGYTPAQYVWDYRSFLTRIRQASESLALSVQLTEPASNQYAGGKAGVLTDRLVGETDYRYNWIGFNGNDMQATLQVADTAGMPFVSNITVSFLQDQPSWVLLPEKVIFELSVDGENFFPIKEETLETTPSDQKRFQTVKATFNPTTARAVRVTAINRKVCPEWHTCNGNPCWIFADEITVK